MASSTLRGAILTVLRAAPRLTSVIEPRPRRGSFRFGPSHPQRGSVVLFVARRCAGKTTEQTMLASSKLQSIIWTSRIEAAERFYRHVLGLPLRGTADGALVFDVGGNELRVSPVPATAPSEHTVMGFAVEDVDATIAALGARGVVFELFD